MPTQQERLNQIRQENDLYRMGITISDIDIIGGVDSISPEYLSEVVELIRIYQQFHEFNASNDPM